MALEKAVFFCPDDPPSVGRVYVQFNPNSLEYSYGKKTFKKSAKKDGQRGVQQSPLAAREQARLSMRLFFNTFESESSYEDVRRKIMPLRAFLCKTGDEETVNGRTVMFAWGTLAFKGTMDGFSASYQMFASDGTPVQAEVSLSITGEDTACKKDDQGAVSESGPEDADAGSGGDEGFGWLFEE